MPRRALPVLFVLLSALAPVAPRRASAWAEGRVRRVRAHLILAPDATTTVTLACEVHVQGGWLQVFELDGLEPDLVLVPDRPPSFEDALGAALAPTVEHRGDGRLVFTFRRRAAPRRGDYVATVVYRSHAVTERLDEQTLRAVWTLPGWRNGLDDVSIVVDAPVGSEPEIDAADVGAVLMTRVDLVDGERFVLRRAHLPRTREWPVRLRIPAARMDPALRALPPVALPPPLSAAQAARPPVDPLGPLAIALLLGACALGRIATIARAEREARLDPTALVPLSTRLRAVLVIALAIAAGTAGAHGADVPFLAGLGAIAILAVHRTAGAPRTPRLGSFRPASAGEIRAARRALLRERLCPLDASTVPGAALLVLDAAAPVVAWARDMLPVPLPHAALASALIALVMVAGHRSTRPGAPLTELAHLLDLAARTAADLENERRWALRPVLHADVRGQLQEARLRVVLPGTPKGLLRLDVARAFCRERAGWSARPVLLVVVREGSPADRALQERFADAYLASAPRRIARAMPIRGADLAAALTPVLEALAACPVEVGTRHDTAGPAALAASA